MKKRNRLWILFLLVIAASPLQAEESVPPEQEDVEEEGIIEEIKLFSKALGVIEEAYPGEVDQRQLLYEAVEGMLESLDRYSEFIGPDKFEILQIHMKGEYAGIGTVLEIMGEFPGIRLVNPDSAAFKAGLRPGDRFLKINGESARGMDLPQAAKRLRGEEGSVLNLTMERPSEKRTFDVEIKREKVTIESVKDIRMVGRAIGYMWIQSWQENTSEQVQSGIENLMQQGMQALILDLRQNDGGLLDEAVELSERFLPADAKIVSVDSKIEEQRKEYNSTGAHTIPRFPMLILVNENSASASEIFSAAMQDHERARIIGNQTFGKASVQSVIPLDDQSAMKLTTARYLSPAGRDLNAVGIEPDMVVENGPEGSPNADRQIVKALELFKEYM